jgi:hypothetical protein
MEDVSVALAPGAEDNGLATMLAELVRQNLEAKPHKVSDFRAMEGAVGLVADDADVALTLRFARGKLVIHDGIVGIPDVTVRGDADTIMALSNMPLSTALALPIPARGDAEGSKVASDVLSAMVQGRFRAYGALFHMPLMLHLTRVMSVNG